jgi:hypothetical protein
MILFSGNVKGRVEKNGRGEEKCWYQDVSGSGM